MTVQYPERSAQQARQARRGRAILKVLVASLVLVAIAFIGLSLLQTAGVEPTIGAIESTDTAQ